MQAAQTHVLQAEELLTALGLDVGDDLSDLLARTRDAAAQFT